MPKIDAQGRVTDATIDEDPDFPTEVQPVDEPKSVMESTPESKQDEKPKQRITRK